MNKSELTLFRRFDLLIFAAVVLLAAALFLSGIIFKKNETVLIVSIDGEESTYSLKEDAQIPVVSNGVSLTVSIKDGAASITETDCKNKFCEHSGTISRSGQIIVCAPARVSVKISGKDTGGELDAVTG